jgi:hypothetical protein
MPAIDPPEDLEPISTVTFAKPRPGDLPYYVMPDTALSHGASFGNKQMWLTSKASGAIHRLFSLELGTDVFGPVVVTYAVPGERPLRLVTTDSSGDEPDVEFTIVHQDGPGVVEVHPMRQHHRMRLSGELRVEEAILLPKTGGDEPSVAVYRVEVTNEAELERAVRVSAYASLQGQTPADIAADYDPKLGALVACNQSQPDWVRIFGSATAPETYETTHDVSQVYGDGRARCLSNDTSATGAVLGALQIDLCLAPGQTKSLSFALAFSAHGEQAARELYLANRDFDGALEKTRAYITPTLSVAMVETPDPVVNEGVFWAKVNMLRVMGDYPKGPAFTNEPGVSSNVVGRDVVWYVYGCDYMMPEFSAQLLRGLARCQYPNGKMVEYYNAITDDRADYGLNVNDDTPLFVLGIHHHFLATGDKDFLRDLYPAAQRAALYFLSQRDERGLVYCSAEGTNVEGIASWRNVIPNYQINGAVTEVNAECHGALRALAEMAGALGKQDRGHQPPPAEPDQPHVLPQHRHRRRGAHRCHRRRDLPHHVRGRGQRDLIHHHQPPGRARLQHLGRPAHGIARQPALRAHEKRWPHGRRVAGPDILVRVRGGVVSTGDHGQGAAQLVRPLPARSVAQQHRAGAILRVVRRRVARQSRHAPIAVGTAATAVGGGRRRVRHQRHRRRLPLPAGDTPQLAVDRPAPPAALRQARLLLRRAPARRAAYLLQRAADHRSSARRVRA